MSIDIQVGDQRFFYLILYNDSETNCNLIVNDGLESEQKVGIIRAGQQNVHAGYYRLFSNSNVSLHCDNTITYWGIRDGEGPKRLVDLLERDGATLKLRLSK